MLRTHRVLILFHCSIVSITGFGWRHARGQEGAATARAIRAAGDPAAPGPRLFRKTFNTKEPGSTLDIDVSSPAAFTLYLDGRELVRGAAKGPERHAAALLAVGDHVLAASVDGPPGELLLRGAVLPLGQGAAVHTDKTWRATVKPPAGDSWKSAAFDDSGWPQTEESAASIAASGDDASRRFILPRGFRVTRVAAPEVTGSAITLAFDEQGRPCVGVERGPVVRLVDADRDGRFEAAMPIVSQVTNPQGIAFIRGALWVVGIGPRGVGIHKMIDENHDGTFETVARCIPTDGMNEHGPHAIALGPDASLYFIAGNHAHMKVPVRADSPSSSASLYEGELLPHNDDPRGHAAGILAPGGEIYRSDDDGATWERVVSGFRNAYDFAFHHDGELFTFDSDMEWDIGLPWYRPVRVTHCPPGADFGWRSGTAHWPAYWPDTLPPILDTGRGSPTGVASYQGQAFPNDYLGNLLLADWSQGRILAVELTRQGASYSAKAKTLVSGRPLNVTDIEVGPEGAVYFTTGGRGTLGGLYRVEWTGRMPPPLPTSPWFFEALGLPSPLSAFGQARLAALKAANAQRWERDLNRLIANDASPTIYRLRALERLAQLGPPPSDALLAGLTKNPDPQLRARAVSLLGRRPTPVAREAIALALTDRDPFVRRLACEALVRSHGPIPVETLLPLLGDPDRFVRSAARIAIEHADTARERDRILKVRGARPQIEAMLALVRTLKLDAPARDDLLRRQLELLNGKLAREERLDLLRLIGLTYLKGPGKPAEVPATPKLAARLLVTLPGPTYSDDDDPIVRETARLLAYLDVPEVVPRLLDLQASRYSSRPTQIHLAQCLRAVTRGWTPASHARYWAWFESASRWDGGFSVLGYLDFMVQDLVPRLTPEERAAYLAQGAAAPFPTRVLVRAIDLSKQPADLPSLTTLYPSLGASANANATAELRSLIIEKLGDAPSAEAHTALRSLLQTDPNRRDAIARALARHPVADDLPVFIAALDSHDPNTTSAVLAAASKVDAKPAGPEALRNLIRLARRTGPPIVPTLNTLGARWTGASVSETDLAAALKAWEAVYRERHPDAPAPGKDSARNAYTLPQLLDAVVRSGLIKKASPERGRDVITRARCLECHKLGDQGQGLGPDLTTVSSRFRPGEILESIVDPSKVISDQYKTLRVALTDGRVLDGMPAGGDATTLILLLPDGTKRNIPKTEIDEQAESNVSVMPEGLLNALTLDEIAALLALFESQPRVDPAAPK